MVQGQLTSAAKRSEEVASWGPATASSRENLWVLVAERRQGGLTGLHCCSAGLAEALDAHQAFAKIYEEGEVSLPKQGGGEGSSSPETTEYPDNKDRADNQDG